MDLAACILFYSLQNDIDPKLTHAVIKHESNYNSSIVGAAGEIGLMQIRPEYVPESKQELFDPCTNVKRGTQILKHAKKYCKHTLDQTWVICYNLGIAGAKKVRYPKLFPYYKKIVENLTTSK
jgi:soluble lytic murein transglycosylase-like protein